MQGRFQLEFDSCLNAENAKSTEKDGGFLIPRRRSGHHPEGEPKSRGNEPRPLVFVFFAFFAVNLDYSFQFQFLTPRSGSGSVLRK
jgi:hypothetical protein